MQRVSFSFWIKPGVEEQYKEAHRNLWPEMADALHRAGIHNYSIFLRGQELFGYYEVDDPAVARQVMASDPVNQRWQAYMAPLMDRSEGHPHARLEEVFHLD